MNEHLKQFYLTWGEMVKVIPSNRLERQRGELLAQKLLELSKKIDEELSVIEN